MAVQRLTQERIERAKPGEMLCDERVTGLMLISQKRVKTWVAQREVKDVETGLRKTARVRLGHFPEISVQEARDLAKEELRKMEKGRNPHKAKEPSLSLRTAVEEYLRDAVTLRPRTLEGYRYTLDHYFTYQTDKGVQVDIGNFPVAELGAKPRIVKDLYVWLTKEKSKAIAVGAMRVLRAVYNRMHELNGELPANPVRRGVIKIHKLRKRTTRILEEDFPAWGTTLRTMPNPIRRAVRLFILLTGQRDTATLKMRWEDIDLRKGKEKIHYPDPKGGPEAAFDLPLSAPVIHILQFVRAFSTEEWAFPGSEWVWPAADSESGHAEETKETNESRKSLLNPHALRRTFISEGYEVAPSKLVTFIVNHACKDNITDDYFVPSTEAIRRALTAIDQSILDKIGIDLATLLGEKTITSTQFGSIPNTSE